MPQVCIKIDRRHLADLLTPGMSTLLDIFRKYDHDIRLVGGAVRDLLVRIKPKDMDLATTATIEQMRDMFAKENIGRINWNAERYGTVTVRIDDENFEITTLRANGSRSRTTSVLDFTNQWSEDASRRDLTINSMFLDFAGTLYDYFGGSEDLRRGRVVFVADAEQRIREDPLRIVRYFRFCARFSYLPNLFDAESLEIIKENASRLGNVAGERIWAELKKILALYDPGTFLQLMSRSDLATRMGLPHQADYESFKQIWWRCDAVECDLEPVTLITSLVSNEDQVKHLYQRLKWSKAERKLCWFIFRHRNARGSGLDVYKKMAADHMDSKNVIHWVAELLKYQCHFELLEQIEDWTLPRILVDATVLGDLKVPRKLMGRVTQQLKDHWVDGHFQIGDEQLADLVPRILESVHKDR